MLARVLAGTQGVFVVFGVMIFNWSDWDMVVWWWWCGGGVCWAGLARVTVVRTRDVWR